MPRSMPRSNRQSQKAETRKALKEAALSSFARLGVASTRVGDITSLAGTAAGTFYVHFASKEALLDELLGDFNSGLALRLMAVWTSESEGLPQRLRASAEAFLAHWEEHRSFVELYAQRVSEGLSLAALRDGINPEAAGLVTAALGEEARRRGGSISDAALVGTGLLAMWARVGLQVLFNPEVERSSAVDTLVRMTLGALSAVLPAEPELLPTEHDLLPTASGALGTSRRGEP